MKRVNPIGRVERLGGRPVHWRERVADSTPVVFDGGCGVAMDLWGDVGWQLLDQHLVSFDRPGLGGTDWSGRLPTLEEERQTLVELLEKFDRPAVVVAHSMAAFHAEAVARTRPELVGAIVMVDPSVEWLASPPKRATPRLASLVRGATTITQIGTLGTLLWRWGTWVQSTRDFAQLHRGRIREMYADPDALAMATAESLAYTRQAWHLVKLRRRWPWPEGIPVTVLSAGEGWGAADSIAQQARLAKLLGGRHEVIEGSRHMMMIDRPEVVAEAVRAAVALVGQRGVR